jgi:hypothetical protein
MILYTVLVIVSEKVIYDIAGALKVSLRASLDVIDALSTAINLK